MLEGFNGSRMKTSLSRSCQLSMFRELCRLAAPKLDRLLTQTDNTYFHSSLLVIFPGVSHPSLPAGGNAKTGYIRSTYCTYGSSRKMLHTDTIPLKWATTCRGRQLRFLRPGDFTPSGADACVCGNPRILLIVYCM